MNGRLFRVTISGADDYVDPADLARLSRKYPFVEWGLLCSTKRFGEPRYPTPAWMARMAKHAHVQLSLHLCGELSRNAMAGTMDLSELHSRFPWPGRVQLNGFSDFILPGLRCAAREPYLLLRPPEIILQCAELRALERGVQLARQHGLVRLLWDVSGGTGAAPAINPVGFPNIMGYAGGLNPENFTRVVKSLKELENVGPFWVDMESGVRTDDRFDLERVQSILEQAASLRAWPENVSDE